jgi:transaldolase/glucose-6-phosphate isomerase
VASFFVSRVDTKVDKLVEEKIKGADDPRQKRLLQALLGKAAVANSKMAYEQFRALHSGERWTALKKQGARVQRPLWASTSVKDPRYSDLMYVEELIGPDTVDTVPPSTLAAFREHGEVRRSLDAHVDVARRQLAELTQAGVDLDQVTRELEVEGVEAFEKSYRSLIKALKDNARNIKSGKGPRQWHSLGEQQPAVDKAVAALQKEDAARRLWSKDSTLWSADSSKRNELRERLGWLTVAEKMQERLPELRKLARDGKTYSDVVLLGMGGSSLAPDVLRHTFGPQKGHPTLHVLDTTDPASIRAVDHSIDLDDTLFIVASKSGETTETLSHFAYYWQRVSDAGKPKPGRHFAAITDPGTSLQKLAQEHDFRWTFLNPPDIGGRYSALSYFGLVPAAVAGIDVAELLERALEMMQACDAAIEVEKNPGAWLGAALGELARSGRNKLTLILSPKAATFGYWVEQLLAESTGKNGKGIVPVEAEPLAPPGAYGDDRLFVYVRLDKDPQHKGVTALEGAGLPVVTLTMRDRFDLGAEFFRWEVATAIAGSVLGIDPFDQPNVQESKDNTRKVLAQYRSSGKIPSAPPIAPGEALARVQGLLRSARPGGYLALMAYTGRSPASERALSRIRTAVRDARKLATTAGYGPRFLHSTGQLHKGGPKQGVFLQIVQEDREDVTIPGQPYSFSVLKQAQALGDLQSLEQRKLPVLRVNLGRSPVAGWKALVSTVEAACR